MNRVGLAAVLLTLAIAGMLILTRSRGSGSDEAVKLHTPHVNVSEDLGERILALEADNRRMRGELALTRARIGNLQEQVAQTALPQAHEQDRDKQEPAGDSDDEARARHERSLVAYEGDLQDQVNLEPADRERTLAVEEVFGHVITQVGNGLTLESASCGTTLCAVAVSHDDELAHTGLTSALHMHRDQIGRALIRRHPSPAGGYRTTYYFSRPGEPLARLEQALVGEYN